MRQALLIGREFGGGARIKVSCCCPEVVVPQNSGNVHFLYVGDVEWNEGETVRLYRHSSISEAQIRECVRVAEASFCECDSNPLRSKPPVLRICG